jgi:hypothetical protein
MPVLEPLTAREQRIVLAVLSTPTLEAAAAQARQSVRTVQRALAKASVEAELRRQQRALFSTATNILAQAAAEAATVLRTIANDRTAPAPSRVTAARAIQELGARAIEIGDYGARLDAIEGELDRRRPTPRREPWQ